jgi:hypothetical protein
MRPHPIATTAGGPGIAPPDGQLTRGAFSDSQTRAFFQTNSIKAPDKAPKTV